MWGIILWVWASVLVTVVLAQRGLLDRWAPPPPHGWVASTPQAEREAGLVFDKVGDEYKLWPGYWEWENLGLEIATRINLPAWCVKVYRDQGVVYVNPDWGYVEALEKADLENARRQSPAGGHVGANPSSGAAGLWQVQLAANERIIFKGNRVLASHVPPAIRLPLPDKPPKKYARHDFRGIKRCRKCGILYCAPGSEAECSEILVKPQLFVPATESHPDGGHCIYTDSEYCDICGHEAPSPDY